MRIGIISSTNGSSFEAAFEILYQEEIDVEFFVITDRECGIEDFCAEAAIECKRIVAPDNAEFSRKAKLQFDEWGGVEAVLLYYMRLVTVDLIEHYLTLNLHESLLPAYRGFQAIKRAIEDKVRFIGTTLHVVDADADTGPIIGQACYPLRPNQQLPELNRISFVHKVYLTLLVVDLLSQGAVITPEGVKSWGKFKYSQTDRKNPALWNHALGEAVLQLDMDNGTDAFFQDINVN